eukprot:m.82705 g.82705  ORF g.82705 m.82705 type:complete len:62 (-) comp8673_c0_seq1:1960-2145(-)
MFSGGGMLKHQRVLLVVFLKSNAERDPFHHSTLQIKFITRTLVTLDSILLHLAQTLSNLCI